MGIRLFFRQAFFAYRALFGWLNPQAYLVMKVLEPATQIVFFSALGSFAGRDPSYYALGNAVRVASVSGIFGCAMVMAGDRRAGTLAAVIASVTPAWETFVSRSIFQVMDGLTTVIVGFFIGGMFFGLDFGQVNWFWLVLALIATSYAMSGLGMLVGASGLVGTDINMVMNLAYAALIVLCGVNFPVSELPSVVQRISSLLPLTHGLEAIRHLFDGHLNDVPALLLTEIGLGTIYILGGFMVFHWAEQKARHAGTLELM
jgi:ABC-2 type transport system permease protein